MKPVEVSETNAPKFLIWLRERGGLSVWSSKDLGGPPSEVTTPYRNSEGEINVAPHWRYGDKPDRHVTNPDDVVVHVVSIADQFSIKPPVWRHGEYVLRAADEKRLTGVLRDFEGKSYATFSDSKCKDNISGNLYGDSDTCTIMKTTAYVPLLVWEARWFHDV